MYPPNRPKWILSVGLSRPRSGSRVDVLPNPEPPLADIASLADRRPGPGAARVHPHPGRECRPRLSHIECTIDIFVRVPRVQAVKTKQGWEPYGSYLWCGAADQKTIKASNPTHRARSSRTGLRSRITATQAKPGRMHRRVEINLQAPLDYGAHFVTSPDMHRPVQLA